MGRPVIKLNRYVISWFTELCAECDVCALSTWPWSLLAITTRYQPCLAGAGRALPTQSRLVEAILISLLRALGEVRGVGGGGRGVLLMPACMSAV